jgi:hypothetical protein
MSNPTTIDDTIYSITNLRNTTDLESLYTKFTNLKSSYVSESTSISDAKLTQYKNSFENISKCLSSNQTWESTGNTFSGKDVSTILDCSGNCSFLFEYRSEIKRLNDKLNSYSSDTSKLTTQADNINKNKRILLTRQARYELAVERNNHRRKMILTVASLNTLLLLFYYMMISD